MIELKNVTKIYPNGTVALRKINLDIEKGDFVYITGESGAGKTTLLRLIHLDEIPTKGEVLYKSKPIKKVFKIYDWRRKAQLAYQDFMLIEDRTVFDNITLPLQIIGEKFSVIFNKAETVLGALKLRDKMHKLVKELSGGEKQRIALGRAVISNPEILLLDEPLGNLDKDTAQIVMDFIEEINEQGITVVMSTHHMVDRKHSTPKRIVKLKDGRLIFKGYV
jgi:cell division transport system ATP-binding protein